MWFITCKKSVKFLNESKANMDSPSSLGILRLWPARARFLSADFCIFQAVGDPSS